MSRSIEKLPNEPILLCTLNADYSAASEAEQFIKDIVATLDAQTEHVYFILDTSEATISLEDVLQGTRLTTQQYDLFKHKHIYESIIVASGRFMKLVVQGLNNPIFGSLNIRQF